MLQISRLSKVHNFEAITMVKFFMNETKLIESCSSFKSNFLFYQELFFDSFLKNRSLCGIKAATAFYLMKKKKGLTGKKDENWATMVGVHLRVNGKMIQN